MNFRVKALIAVLGMIAVGIVLHFFPSFFHVGLPNFVGIGFMVYGLIGLVQGRITVRGKFGPGKIIYGSSARIVGIIFIILGLVAVPVIAGETFWSPALFELLRI
jgi:hypothetical protein